MHAPAEHPGRRSVRRHCRFFRGGLSRLSAPAIHVLPDRCLGSAPIEAIHRAVRNPCGPGALQGDRFGAIPPGDVRRRAVLGETGPAGLEFDGGAAGLARDEGGTRVIRWLEPVIPHLKALHIATLGLWCAGLFALPLMLSRHGPAIAQLDYAHIRRTTHYGYTYVVSPAGIIAIATGTLLIFLREVFVLWMFAKLVFVALLVAFHAWVSYTIVAVAETPGSRTPPAPLRPALLLTFTILAILALVLGKPDLGGIPMPAWLTEPWAVQLPFDVPKR